MGMGQTRVATTKRPAAAALPEVLARCSIRQQIITVTDFPRFFAPDWPVRPPAPSPPVTRAAPGGPPANRAPAAKEREPRLNNAMLAAVSDSAPAAATARPSTPPPSRRAVFVRRLSTTVVLWAAMVTFIVFESGLLCFGVIALFSLASLYEVSRLLPASPAWIDLRRWSLLVSLLYLGASAWWILRHDQAPPFAIDVAALVVLFQGCFWLCYRRQLEARETLFRIFFAIFAFIYTILFFACLTRVLYFNGVTQAGAVPGVWLVLFLLAVTKFTDMGAYFIGTLIGRHKMVPHISPGKTWQGLGGAYFAALVAAVGLILCLPQQMLPLTLGHGVALALLLGTAAIAGDLAESVLKRCFDIKDSGHTLPGIGGVLDLTDSVLFTAPLLYFYLIIVLG